MKHLFFLFCLGLGMLTATHAQKTSTVSRQQLDSLMKSSPVDTAQIVQKLKQLVNTDNELNWTLATNFYYRLGKTATIDSLQKAELKRFPLGLIARSEASKAISAQTTAEAAEKAYDDWIAKFPPEHFSNENHSYVIYDYVTSGIASKYAKENNVAKAKEFSDKLLEEFWKGNAYGGLAEIFYKNGDLANAEIYSKKAMESARLFLDAEDNAGKFAASGYPGLTRTYARILYEENKYEEALRYIDTVFHMDQQIDPATHYTYAKLLVHAHRNAEAYDKLEAVVKTGKATPAIDSMFRELFLEQKGDREAYTAYMTENKKVILETMRETLRTKIIDKPAPGFTLKDVDGKEVALSQYKGKTVVLDFWATWCGPCKKSFPTMQKAINKYQKDPDVKFLFIHTWERDKNATQEARDFIAKNHYDFEVLMDLKDPDTQQNNVVKRYGVSGIPTKFVIDPKGNIRFQLTGFDGSEEQGLNEISMMIEMARQQN